MRTSRISALCLTLLAACGGSSDPTQMTNDASTALNNGQYAEALAGFEAALGQMDASHASYMRAKMGSFDAQIHIDAGKAQTDFLAFAQANKGKINEKDYRQVGSKMTSAGKYLEAIAVLDAGIKEFGKTDALMKTIDAVKKESANDAAAQSALAGLGYL